MNKADEVELAITVKHHHMTYRFKRGKPNLVIISCLTTCGAVHASQMHAVLARHATAVYQK